MKPNIFPATKTRIELSTNHPQEKVFGSWIYCDTYNHDTYNNFKHLQELTLEDLKYGEYYLCVTPNQVLTSVFRVEKEVTNQAGIFHLVIQMGDQISVYTINNLHDHFRYLNIK